ncbi:hypothetical protein [Cohaesibacter celericrescens]|uniref:Uncharacterized protein n=1 Tax=Cohaesibacter celericrescens TaxID=2067669 RepID=A0A2N5XQ38_9HYPH|nr:hypothetical protein [Cohaesibacter celericrescens]PLW76641.1 hypothetical protein C0081_13695 [Cohaesibacter celericrescens]
MLHISKFLTRIALMAAPFLGILLSNAYADDFLLPAQYWPNGFAWHDHHFTGWNGVSVFRQGRTNPKEYPVIVFSNSGQGSVRGDVIPQNALDYAIKDIKQQAREVLPTSIPGAHCWKHYSSEKHEYGGVYNSILQFTCYVGRVNFYIDLRSIANTEYVSRKTRVLNYAISLAELHKVAYSIIAGYRRYAIDNGYLDARFAKADAPYQPPKPVAIPQTDKAPTQDGVSIDQPLDGFDAWKRDFEVRGWRYKEKDGYGEFEPQEGAQDKRGWIYSEATGQFAPPPSSNRDGTSDDLASNGQDGHVPPQPKDGDENEYGEVWSDEDGGWIGRNLYEQEKKRRADIKRRNEQPSQQDQDVKKLHDAWLRSRLERKIQPIIMSYVAEEKKKLDGRMENLIRGETDLDRIRFLRDLQDQLNDIDDTDKNGVLGDWDRIVKGQEKEGKFKVDYTMKQFIAETGAMTLDTFLTRGAAMATVHTYNAAVREANKKGSSKLSVVWEGTKEGVYQGTLGFVLNRLTVGAFSKAKTMREASQAAKAAKAAKEKAKAASKVKGNWNSSSTAIRDETQKKLLAKLPSNHPARQIGKLNETLGKAGKQFDARKINPHMRLDPTSETYKAGIQALKKNPRYLSEKAKKVTDAVRHDLDLAAREKAVRQLYKERPDLKGHLTHFENTGSHARKGHSYRGGSSDIDFTPKGTATPQGRDAEKLFSKFYDKAVKQVSGGKLTTQDIKAHAYGGDQGTGAFRSETGLKLKNIMNQTSGRIDKLDPSGKITHSLRGDDVIEVGTPTRMFNKGTTERIAKREVENFRKDLANKFREELPEMATQQEKLIQAAKGYKLSRVIEAKAVGGRALYANRALYQWSKQIKNRIPNMSDSQMKAMTEKFLNGIEEGR